jgi:ankyrin repeat protein
MSIKQTLSQIEISLMQKRYYYLTNYVDNDPDAPIDPLTYRDSNGDGLLHIAARSGDAETVGLLIKAGVDVNLRGDMDSTPLHYAMEKEQKEVVNLLLAHGARSDVRNRFGQLPGDS